MTGAKSLAIALVLRPLIRERLRSLLTVAGIAVGIAVLVAIQLANGSALRSFAESVDAIAGRANYTLVSDAGLLDETVMLKLMPLWADGARFAPVIDIEGFIEPMNIPIRLLAVDLLSDLHFRDYRYARVLTESGERRAASGEENVSGFLELFRRDSIVIPESFAAEHKLELGDQVVLDILGQRQPMTVRGILQTAGPATAFNGSIAIADIAAAQQSFGLHGKLSRVDLLLPPAAENRLGTLNLPPSLRLERPSRRNERVEKMLRAFRINLFALAAVALLVGIFMVYNTVLVSILRRRRDIGILKTLGVSSWQLFTAFVVEGAVLGALGSALGLVLGYALAWSILELIGQTVNVLYVPAAPQQIEMTPRLAVIAIVLGTLVSMLAAVQPAIEAARSRPNALIRPGLYQRLASGQRMRLIVVAVICFLGAAGLAFLPPVDGISVGGYGSVLLVLAGFSLLAPAALVLASVLLRPLMKRLFTVAGPLASSALPASLRRTSIAAAALAIAIGMMVAVSMMIGSFRETVRIWVNQTVQSDLWLRPAKGLTNAAAAVFPASIGEELKTFDFIDAFDRVRARDLVYQDQLIALGSGDFEVIWPDGAGPPMKTPSSNSEAIRAALQGEGVLVSESFALKFGKGVGDSIELPTVDGVEAFRIHGVYRDYSNDRGVVAMDRSLYIRKYGDDTINTIAVFLKDGVDPNLARRELEQRLGAKYRVFVLMNAAIKKEVMQIFDQTFLITWALLGVALVVAVLGIVNTLSALILERKREVALLRVMGMTPRQVTTMIVLESLIIGAASTAIGLASGYALSWILIFVINKQSFGWTIEFDPPALLVAASLAATFLATIVAGLIPSRLATRLAIAAELKTE